MTKKSEIGLIILAAGASVRMGKPKQLLEFNGKTLLQRAVQTALDSECRPIVVVLGARIEFLKNEIKDFDVQIAENADWEKGMSSSIKTGLEKLLEINNQISGIVIMVCDQPFVSAELINQIIETLPENRFFDCRFPIRRNARRSRIIRRTAFSATFRIRKFRRCEKILLRQFQNETVSVSFEKGNFDIDTPEDYLKLCRYKS